MYTSAAFAQSLEPAPGSGTLRADSGTGPVGGWTRRISSPWYVTVPVTLPDGRTGTQTFVEWADSRGQAREEAIRKAGTPDALRHRRNAVVVLANQVTVEPWRRPAWW
ncbi:hypothetical protein [Streptomyces sp. CB03911]|uniref:hypothetical protein n=1 Tax=Streptomyces sp. CB03911 TaxID=1804758 RepID=UPI00093EA1BB|nr:hypothetical protein [Streptomyces sp. CB03911]OKI12524.1 hypothetical protein A6A07_16595 [Streptomyces sp. CB03911]